MLTDKLKRIGLKSLKYIFFLTAVMTWMIVLGPKESLSAQEQIDLQTFVAQTEMESSPNAQVATEVPMSSGIQYGIVLEDGLNVRSGPGTEYPSVMMLYQNTEVQLVEELPGGWWKILVDATNYYVKSEFIALRTITGLQ